MVIHVLKNGATVLPISPSHGFSFSDGTSCPAQEKSLCDKLTLSRQLRKVGEIKGMTLNEVKMVLNEDQIDFLREISKMADIVILPFPVLTALREQGIRDEFPNCVAFNATQETQRAAPADKVIDINNWSY